MKKVILLFIAIVLSGILTTGTDVTQYVDPSIGNVPKLLRPTRPTFHLPGEMIRMYPIRGSYLDDQVTAFPLHVIKHQQPGIMRLTVSTGEVDSNTWSRRMSYDHDLEQLKPWHYSTYLIDNDISLEFTPGKKTAAYRITFPEEVQKNILFRGDGPLTATATGGGTFQLKEEISYTPKGPGSVTRIVQAYCHAELVDNNGDPIKGVSMVPGKNRLLITVPADGPSTITIKYAISHIDFNQAHDTYQREIQDRHFDELVSTGKAAWESILSKIKVEGGTEAQKRSMYSSLYRALERPVDINEYGRYYSAYDNQVHESDEPFYVGDWIWDSYLAQHPLRILLMPDAHKHYLNSLLKMYQQSGWMPNTPQLVGNRQSMNGFHASGVFIDAYRKGLEIHDWETAYAGVRNNLMNASMIPWRQFIPKTPLDDFFHEHGYYPALRPGEPETEPAVDSFEKRQAVAVTLAISYDNWALSELAKEMGKADDHEYFAEKALGYRQLWHPGMQLFMPKDSEGNWIDIDPKFDGGPGGRHFYDENNGWTYAWMVKQDISGLIGLLGGKEAAEARLDQLFREPLDRSRYAFNAEFPDSTGMVGQFSMGNEPSFHIPFLYNYFGAPWKTQKWIRLLLDVWFDDTFHGIPGDEDGGAVSAFSVFSHMGFYPIVPGLPYYTIGSPVFEKTSIELDNGKTFSISAPGASKRNKYIQEAFLNGKQIDGPFFTHDDLMNGGTLKLIMGEKPNKEWGKTAKPPY